MSTLMRVNLVASFGLSKPVYDEIYAFYKEVVNRLIYLSFYSGKKSIGELQRAVTRDWEAEFRDLPKRFLYPALRIALSYLKKDYLHPPVFNKDLILLPREYVKLDFDSWTATIYIPGIGKMIYGLLHSTYHEKFRDKQIKRAYIIRKEGKDFLKVVFTKLVALKSTDDIIGVDVNENNITVATSDGFLKFTTNERIIREIYTRKKRKLATLRAKRAEKLKRKYRQREFYRIQSRYHEIAKRIVKIALKKNAGIALENLRFKKHCPLKWHKERCAFRRFQRILSYKAKSHGLPVYYIDPKNTSKTCPNCGNELQYAGKRIMKCSKCGMVADKDEIGSLNIRKRGLLYVRQALPSKASDCGGI